MSCLRNSAYSRRKAVADAIWKSLRDYFAPLQKWLDEQNKGKPAVW